MISTASMADAWGVRPARDLVQVVADTGDLADAVALDLGRGRGQGAGLRHGLPQQVGERHADGLGLGPPRGGLRAGETRRWICPARRSAISAPAQGFGGGSPRGLTLQRS